jgi:alcohol dehydrogenase
MIVPGGPAMDDYLSGTLPQTEALPYIEIPTTCRNPFMLVDEYLMVDARDRTGKIGKTQEAITKAALVDPKLSFTLPAKYTLTTLLDVLLSGIEGLMSTKTNFLTETLRAFSGDRKLEIQAPGIHGRAARCPGTRLR